MKLKPALKDYVEGVLAGDLNIISQAITLVESKKKEDNQLSGSVLNELMPHTGKSIRMGITGAPGVGKSTFIDKFGLLVLANFKKLAVLAVDPTSSQTYGSIMGDKTRMNELLTSKNVFVRPSPAGATLGGVAGRTREAILICEAAGFDFILVETVGVGQSEIAVKNMVDYLLLLLSPSSGDQLQGMKRGIVEIADAISITKADGNNREAAEMARKEYSSALQILGDRQGHKKVPVTTCSSLENRGLQEILDNTVKRLDELKQAGQFEKTRNEQLISWLHQEIAHYLHHSFYQDEKKKKLIKEIEDQIRKRELSPKSAILRLFGPGDSEE